MAPWGIGRIAMPSINAINPPVIFPVIGGIATGGCPRGGGRAECGAFKSVTLRMNRFLQSEKKFKKFQTRLKKNFHIFSERSALMNEKFCEDTGTPPEIPGKLHVILLHPEDLESGKRGDGTPIFM